MFDKYSVWGAYHWQQLNPLNFHIYNPRLLARYQAIMQAIQHQLKLCRSYGLDIGCGDGALYGCFTQMGATMVGMDTEITGLHAAQSTLGRPSLSMASAYKLPFAPNIFDFAVMSELIEHLEAPQRCLAEAVRVLRPGGVLVVTTPRRNLSGQLHSSHHIREFDERELENLLELYLQDVSILGMYPLCLTRRYTGKSFGARLLCGIIKVLTILGFNPFVYCRPLGNKKSWDHLIAMGRKVR